MGYTPHVLIVGGGVLGTAIARDFAIRGLEVTLVEQGTLTAGATGRMHGVLYSGARFAATDRAGAVRCRSESEVLREIADHCLQSTGAIIAEEPGRSDRFGEYMIACEECDIPFQELADDEKRKIGLSETIDRAIRVPESVVDPFELTLSNAAGAREYGAVIKTGAAVEDIRFEDGRVAGVTVEYDTTSRTPSAPTTSVSPDAEAGPETDPDEAEDADSEDETSDTDEESDGRQMPGSVQRSFPGGGDDGPDEGDREEIEADFVVNATGAWADRIAAKAGIDLPLTRARGRMLVLEDPPEHTYTQYDPDLPLSLSPFWGNAVLGPIDADESIEEALDEMSTAYPAAEDKTVLRSYSGVWTQHRSSEGHPYGPGATMIDHEKFDDQWGLLSVVGGTLTTHRLVAKQVVDRVCREFGITRQCLTDEIPLPEVSHDSGSSSDASGSLLGRAATGTSSTGGDDPDPVLCESQSVGREAVQSALESDDVRGTDLTDVRIRTGATMGPCQGGRCGHRIAAQLYPDHDPDDVAESLDALLASRWRGRRDTLWGSQLVAAMDDYEFHASVLNRGGSTEEVALAAFDDGPDPGERERPQLCEAVVYE